MMAWCITHKLAYDTGFVELPKGVQRRATKAQASLARDPVTARGNTIRPLKGWKNVWRYRLGDYRLIYSVDRTSHVVRLLAIGPRNHVYQRFNYDPAAEPTVEAVFDSELAARLEPKKEVPARAEHPEWYQSQRAASVPLPQKLSPSVLHRWRVAGEYHESLMRCRTDDDLLQAEVPESVMERVMDALWPPEAGQIASQPDQALLQPEDLERYAEGTLRGFLLHLDDHQRLYTEWALAGPTLVKGGPGSGKSTVALYRVRALVEHSLRSADRVPQLLFTTYTNALTNYSESLLHQLLRDVLRLKGGKLPRQIRVTTVDKTVMWIARDGGWSGELADHKRQLEALTYALAALKPTRMGDAEKLRVSTALRNLRPGYLLQEFEWVIEGQDCRQLADYLKANRAGRAIPFSQNVRSAVWKLYSAYHNYLEGRNLWTWGQLRQLALDQVRSGAFTRRWEHVIVDEAQDLTPLALGLCVELCRAPSGLFLTADANQSLYNRAFRWRNVHQQLQVTGRTRILRRNYRSTRQIAHAAAELMVGMDGADDEAMQQEFVHTGQLPVTFAASGAAEQVRWLASQIWHAAKELRLPVNAAAVLVPSNSLGPPLAEMLAQHGLPARYMRSREVQLESRYVKVMTLHAAKGLEFPIVAVAHVEADRLPRETTATDPHDIQEHLDNQLRLLYVGCTRAMRHLFLTCDRSLPSPFLERLSDRRWLRIGLE